MSNFNTINQIPNELLALLDSFNFSKMSQIQELAIEPILDKKNILAQSKTGSGKTLAFGIPTVINTDTSNNKPQTLIITPTRELADQVATELRKVAAYKTNLKILTLYGGVPLRTQASSLEKGAHILVGTPGRIKDHLSKETLNLDTIKSVILDEADRMLDMGFYDEITNIISNTPKDRQVLLFSATFPQSIEKLAKKTLVHYDTIKVDTIIEKNKIEEHLYIVDDKLKALLTIIKSYKPTSLLIFTNTKVQTTQLADQLHSKMFSTIDLHGDLDQDQRNETVIAFSNGSKKIMVATDVASRGLDIKNIDLVINYDIPFDQEVYTHRIGRTGRADATGKAVSILTSKHSSKCDYVKQRATIKSLEDLRVEQVPLSLFARFYCIKWRIAD